MIGAKEMEGDTELKMKSFSDDIIVAYWRYLSPTHLALLPPFPSRKIRITSKKICSLLGCDAESLNSQIEWREVTNSLLHSCFVVILDRTTGICLDGVLMQQPRQFAWSFVPEEFVVITFCRTCRFSQSPFPHRPSFLRQEISRSHAISYLFISYLTESSGVMFIFQLAGRDYNIFCFCFT